MKASDMHRIVTEVDIIIFVIGAVVCVLLILLTYSASAKMTAAAQKAKTDPLTRLLNRDGFYSAARESLRHSPDSGIMLIFDVDNFKKVNDQLGHPVGDRFLRDLAALLDSYFNRNTDICARLGGDEFAVYVERKLDSGELHIMLEKFIALFHNTFDGKYHKQEVSVSIGASFASSGDSRAIDEIYKKADDALYQAKKDGKDRFVINE